MGDNRGGDASANQINGLSSGAHALSVLGEQTAAQVRLHFLREKQGSLFQEHMDGALRELADAFRGWDDSEAAKLVSSYADFLRQSIPLHTSQLCKWITAHRNDHKAVLDCMSVKPPKDIDIMRRLPQKGSQKIVFAATWRLTQRPVVLKKLLVRSEILAREKITAPLSIKHPRIIETYFMHNSDGEEFLVEEYPNDILSDGWDPQGGLEAANLLYDIADALTFVHDELRWAHGDVKPDNIGRKGNTYILIDFGIARPIDQFVVETTATGSLRTRCPELLSNNQYEDPSKADVWALGAVVFNGLTGRFPLIDRNEPIPRVSNPEERKKFEATLAARVTTAYDKWVDLSMLDEPFRDVLTAALQRDPRKRASARELMKIAEREFTAFLRSASEEGRFLPTDELMQIIAYFPSTETLRVMTSSRKRQLFEKLTRLKKILTARDNSASKIDSMLETLRHNA